jgi:hypothetical protein
MEQVELNKKDVCFCLVLAASMASIGLNVWFMRDKFKLTCLIKSLQKEYACLKERSKELEEELAFQRVWNKYSCH